MMKGVSVLSAPLKYTFVNNCHMAIQRPKSDIRDYSVMIQEKKHLIHLHDEDEPQENDEESFFKAHHPT